MAATLKWFSLATDTDPDIVTYTGNFKIEGDVEISGLVRRGGQVFDAITPQWNTISVAPGSIFYSPGLNKNPTNKYTSISLSTVSLGTLSSGGSTGVLYIGTDLDYVAGDTVKFIYDSGGSVTDDASYFFTFQVTGYNKNTGAISGTVNTISGTGVYNKWNVYLFDTQTKVGVGTLNPEYMLDVNGDIRYTGKLFRDTSEVNFGLGAWVASNLGNDNTVFYGGSGARIGVGSGFGSTLVTQTASGTLHVWEDINTGTWEPNSCLRIGPEQIDSSFIQVGITRNSHGWMQVAHTGSSLGSYSFKPLVLNPVGGNVGIGTTVFTNSGLLTLNHINPAQNRYENLIYRTIQLTRASEERNLVFSNRVGIMFDDVTSGNLDPKIHFVTRNGAVSWENTVWQASTIMSISSNGKVGIGTLEPVFRLDLHSQGTCGILFNNTGLLDTTQYVIERNTNGLIFGRLSGGTSVINDMYINASGFTVTNNINTTGEYRINNTPVIQGTKLGDSIVNSNLRTLGILSGVSSSGFYNARIADGTTGHTHYMLSRTDGTFRIGLGTLPNDNFTIWRYADNGSFLGNSLVVDRLSGYIGIGIDSPEFPLHITNFKNYTYTASLFDPFLREYNKLGESSFLLDYTGTFSIFCNNTIGASSFFAFSDIRIKKNIENVNTPDALRIIDQLQPVRYEYINHMDGSGVPVYGFIAQQVKSVLPCAIKYAPSYIPNIYKQCLIEHPHKIYLETTTLTKGDKIKIDENITTVVKEVYENYIIVEDKLPENVDKIFVYGKHVDDFHTLDDSAITAVNTAAIKALDRENQELKLRIERLEALVQKLVGNFDVSQ